MGLPRRERQSSLFGTRINDDTRNERPTGSEKRVINRQSAPLRVGRTVLSGSQTCQ